MGKNSAPIGSVLKKSPIKNPDDIRVLKNKLYPNPREYALFVVGINTNLRAVDLCRLTKGQVKELMIGDDLWKFREQKTKKLRTITWNRPCFESVRRLLKEGPLIRNETDDTPLFRGRRGNPNTNSIIHLVKKWAASIGLDPKDYGSHSLRKTFGYQHRTQHKTPLPELMVMFNHKSESETLNYLCIQRAEIRANYLKEI